MNPTHEIPWSISDFFPLRGRVLRAGPPGPLCFLFFVFSHPPTTSNAQGRPLTERSKTLGPATLRALCRLPSLSSASGTDAVQPTRGGSPLRLHRVALCRCGPDRLAVGYCRSVWQLPSWDGAARAVCSADRECCSSRLGHELAASFGCHFLRRRPPLGLPALGVRRRFYRSTGLPAHA